MSYGLAKKIGPAVEAAEPSSNGQAPGAAGNGTSEAGSRAAEASSGGAGRTVNGHRRTLLSSPHPYPGRLIAVEGIDGSGKSTQVKLLERWLRARGYPVHFTEWNSSRLARNSMRRGKRRNLLTPSTFSLLHAVDFADRFIYQILPPLRAGMIVLADRYVYTAFARDVARGVHPDWVRGVHRFAPRPDLTFFFRVPIDVSLERLLAGRAKLKYYEAGMDWDYRPISPRASVSSRDACWRFTISWPRNSICGSSTPAMISPASRRSCAG